MLEIVVLECDVYRFVPVVHELLKFQVSNRVTR